MAPVNSCGRIAPSLSSGSTRSAVDGWIVWRLRTLSKSSVEKHD